MNPSTLTYRAAVAHIDELHDRAARSRTPSTTANRVAAAAVRPHGERRGALRTVLVALLGR